MWMTINELEVGTKITLDQKVLAAFCKERRKMGDYFQCTGDFGAELHPIDAGAVIRNCAGYDRFGDMCYTYDVYISAHGALVCCGYKSANGILICCDERLAVESMSIDDITLRSLDNNNVSLTLSKSTFEQVAFAEIW